MYNSLRTILPSAILLLVTLCGRGQTNCSLFRDSSHIRACLLYNATDSLAQGSAICQLYLDSAVRICPDYAEAWHEMSVPYLKRGDFISWRKYLDKAVALKPLPYLGNRGWCRFKFLRDYEGALQDLKLYDTLTSFDPGPSGDGSYSLTIVLALCERELGHDTAALHYFSLGIDSVRARKGSAWIGLYDYVHRAVLKIRLRDYQGALQDLDLGSERFGKYAETDYYRGLIFKATGRLQEAATCLEKARTLFTKDGYHFSDPYCEVQDEVHLDEIEAQIASLPGNRKSD